MSDTCEKCQGYDDTTQEFSILNIPCHLCKSCYRAWARRYHKHPRATDFEVCCAQLDTLRAQWIGRNTLNGEPFKTIRVLVEAREAIESELLEDIIDWLEEPLL